MLLCGDPAPRCLFADYISKPKWMGGIGFGDGPTALVFAMAVAILVIYLTVAQPDIQPAEAPESEDDQALKPVTPSAARRGPRAPVRRRAIRRWSPPAASPRVSGAGW